MPCAIDESLDLLSRLQLDVGSGLGAPGAVPPPPFPSAASLPLLQAQHEAQLPGAVCAYGGPQLTPCCNQVRGAGRRRRRR